MSTLPRLTAADIRQQLDSSLHVEFSFLRTDRAATVLAALSRDEQDLILLWVKRLAAANVRLAYQFILPATEVVGRLELHVFEAWAMHAMDLHDEAGLTGALDAIHNVQDIVQLGQADSGTCVLEDVVGVLRHFAHGLPGYRLELAAGERTLAGPATIFLPPRLEQLPSRQQNFLLYKALIVLHWARLHYGSFQLDVQTQLQRFAEPRRAAARAMFVSLETLRLEAKLAQELPGLSRDMQQLRTELGHGDLPADWQALQNDLRDGSVRAVWQAVENHLGRLTPLPAVPWEGQLDADAVAMQTPAPCEPVVRAGCVPGLTPKGESVAPGVPAAAGQMANRAAPASRQRLTQAFPNPLPDPSPDQKRQTGQPAPRPPQQDRSGPRPAQNVYFYPEWDYRRQHYRRNRCSVRELDVTPCQDTFVAETLHKYRGHIRQLRKTFELLRDEDRLLRRQPHGDGVDIEALVEALADVRDGSEMSDRLYTRKHRVERNVAVAFLVDMSASTRGWINQAERETLLLLCETLETLGDRYAIYGFSGSSHHHCRIYRIKQFDESYNALIQARISGIQPQDYTRMGFAIRHLSQRLNEVEAHSRVLIALSDGRPDDRDNYRGDYGIEDTRRALQEARRAGIHPYCITIDRTARDYLPRLYGPAAYTVIDQVQQLPLRVSNIYRRLTT